MFGYQGPSVSSSELSVWASWAGIISTSVLAGAALFAFFLQRARYLRETDVVLRTTATMPNVSRQRDGSYTVQLSVEVRNSSEQVHIYASPPEVSSLYFGEDYEIAGWTIDKKIIAPLPPGDSFTYKFELPVDLELIEQEKFDEFILYVTLKASARYDGVSCIFLPWNFGMRRLRRELQIIGNVLIDRRNSRFMRVAFEPPNRGFEDRWFLASRLERFAKYFASRRAKLK